MVHTAPSISDEQLREVILNIFAADSRIAPAGLRVGVLNGIAHLAGMVDSLTTREVAEDLVKKLSGIRGVVNRIDAPGAPSPSREVNIDLDK